MYDNINDFKYLLINRKLKKSSLLKDMQKRAFQKIKAKGIKWKRNTSSFTKPLIEDLRIIRN